MTLLKTSRRGFLQGVGGGTFLGSTLRFFTRNAEAAAYPTRFLFVYSSAGRDSDSRCTGTGPGFTFGPGLAALEPMRKKILVLDGLRIPDHVDEEHPNGRASMLTAWASGTNRRARGISIDRYLANKLAAGSSVYTGQQPPGGDIDVPISWQGGNAANDGFIAGSSSLMAKLFAGMTPAPAPMTMPTPTPTTPVVSARDQNETALYDYLMGEVKKLQKVAPQTEVEKLQLHVQALEQIRAPFAKPVDTMGPGMPMTEPTAMLRTCGTVSLTGASAEQDKLSLILAHALACGRTRVAVVRLGTEEPHHDYSHWQDSAGYRDKLRQIDRDDSASFVKLLGYLDSFAEGPGTLLDNTIVVWSSEVSGEHGTSGDIHGVLGMPFILAGGLGGKIKTGQRIEVPGRTNGDLFKAIALAMGVPSVTDYGDPAFTKGPLQEILV